MPNQPQFTFTVPGPATPSTVEVARRPRRFHGALWLIGIGLLANAAVMLVRGQGATEIVLGQAAMGQATPAAAGGQMLGARGIYMMPAQLGVNSWGLYLMDVDSGTICVYKATPETSHFRLMA